MNRPCPVRAAFRVRFARAKMIWQEGVISPVEHLCVMIIKPRSISKALSHATRVRRRASLARQSRSTFDGGP